MDSDYKQAKVIIQRSSRKKKSDYSDDNNDCLKDAFINIYKCIQFVYEFFFKSFWQVVLFTKEEMYNDNKTMSSIDVMSMNNSAGENYSEKIFRELPRHHLSMIPTNNQRRYRHQLQRSSSQHSRQKILSKTNSLSNKTRVTVRSISNQNLNHTPITESKHSSNTLGTIDSHIIVAPVSSSHCQQMTSKAGHIDLKQPENTNLREQAADALCRRSYEPLTFMNRGMCCGCCRPLIFPNAPFHPSGHSFPQQQLNEEKELSQKSTKLGDASETQSTPYSVSPSVRSQVTESPEGEPVSNNTMFNNDPNQSIFSFPDHDTPLSQQSEELIDDDGSQLKLDAQNLVDDLIQNAQDKYQRILQMSTNQTPQNSALDTSKETTKPKPKTVSISDESNQQKSPTDNKLCQELCNKLNLSDPNQISEIIRILASTAPHILKEQPSTTNKDNENNPCSQLLLHPPFKPKRLIHLCPDGSIQVLSAVDDDSNTNQQQYILNYSNSALIPTNESSLALEYETTATTKVDLMTNFNYVGFTASAATQQSYSNIDKNLIEHPLTVTKNDHDPIVKINLDLNDVNSEDDENSLPEIFFKRIIVPESNTTPPPVIPNQSRMNKKDEETQVRRKNHHRSRSHSHKKAIHTEK